MTASATAIPSSNSYTYDVIVIGSGIGGLAVASILSQVAGKRVLVLERHFRAGGYSHEFSRPGGYHWDVGIHYVGQLRDKDLPGQIMRLVCGPHLQWQPMPDDFERFVYPDLELAEPSHPRRYLQRLQERFPAEAPAIAQYFADVKAATAWYGTQCTTLLFPTWLRGLPKLTASRRGGKLRHLTVAQYLDTRFKDPKLRAVLASQCGDYGLPPSQGSFLTHAQIVNHYFYGASYPVGGAGQMAQGAQALIAKSGGGIKVNHEVTDILIENGRAVGVAALKKHGKNAKRVEFRAPVVVSDAGARITYERLLPEALVRTERAELARLPHTGAYVTAYLGLTASPAELGVQGENFWIFTSYDFEQMYARRNDALTGNPAFAYISFPSLKAPLAKAHTAEIITFVDYQPFAPWANLPWKRRGPQYEALKQKIGEGLLAIVEKRLPGLTERVAFCEVSTPLSTESLTGHVSGGAYGLPAVPERVLGLRCTQTQTAIPGLYMTGADTIGHGVMGALMGGFITSAVLLGGVTGAGKIIGAARKAVAHAR